MAKKKFSNLDEEEQKLVLSFFKRAHLKYLTKAKDREPTLYFSNGNHDGRIRQEHEKGAKVQIAKNILRIFIYNEKGKKAIYNIIKKDFTGKSIKDFKKWAQTSELFEVEPKNNFFQIEIHTKEGNITGKLHKSEGTVVTDLKKFNAKEVDNIIKSLTEKDEKIFEIDK